MFSLLLASGKLSWDQVLRYARLRKKYISLYASLLKSDLGRPIVDDNVEIEELDRELDIDLILQWRMLAHKFVKQTTESEIYLKKQNSKKSWWSFGWGAQSTEDETEPFHFSDEDWQQLNKIIGYKEGEDEQSVLMNDKMDAIQTFLEVHMKHNASKLLDGAQDCLAELSCEDLDCFIKIYPETKVFDMKLGSYQLSSPNGLLAESATMTDSLVGVFSYKPFDAKVDWSMIAKASPCYMTYLKDPIDEIVKFFENNAAISQTIALETAAAVQMTIDEFKRTAQQQVNRALRNQTSYFTLFQVQQTIKTEIMLAVRFLLDLDIAAPKITVPTEFCPDNSSSTKLLLDLGNLVIRSQDDNKQGELDMYLKFDLVLSDVSAFLVDGDYDWSQSSFNRAGSSYFGGVNYLPVVDQCGVILNFQQIRLENPSYPSTRLAVRLPSLGFHFSPARYHRLMQVVKIFQTDSNESSDLLHPWNQADFEGWLSLLTWKGVGNREAVWQRRYVCLVGPFLYLLESPDSKSYKQYFSLRGKQIYRLPEELVGNVEHVLAICETARSIDKIVEDVNALILRYDSDDARKTWQSRLQGAIYRTSASAPITGLSDTSSDPEDSEKELSDQNDVMNLFNMERVFITGMLDELKISVNYSHENNLSFSKVLLADESRLLEFRATGGHVEISIRENDMFIGTVLKSLEIEDLICSNRASRRCYIARSFIGNVETDLLLLADAGKQNLDGHDRTSSEGEDNFFEASESLVDTLDTFSTPRNMTEYYLSARSPFPSGDFSFKAPSFSRVAGLLPTDDLAQTTKGDIELAETLDSFVKAQIVIYDQNSPLYKNTDKQVAVTLATLSFFCRRPTILALMQFVDAINIEDESIRSFNKKSPPVSGKHDSVREDEVENLNPVDFEEAVVKGLLGKGKSRIIFKLTLNMARAQILLMNEDETKLATLSQDNLLTDIKVFPSSYSIKAALGNLRISDDSLPSSHMYFWMCDMRNPGGSSFVELVFTSFNTDDEDYEGYEYSLFGQLSEVRVVYLNRFIQEVVSYFMGLVPNDAKGVVKLKDQVTNSEKWFTTSEIEGSPAVKFDLSLTKPIILMPRKTDSPDYLKLDVVHITVQNSFQWFGGGKNDINAVHLETLSVMIDDINLNVGTGSELGESIIKDVKGVSLVIRRSLRDLLHQIPNTEAEIKIEELKASLSSKEYQIISECALSNISETPHIIPSLKKDTEAPSSDAIESVSPETSESVETETPSGEVWIAIKVSVVVNLIELCLCTGEGRDASLATVQVSGAWLLYKSNTVGEGFLSASLKNFSVNDDRDGTQEEFRLAIGKPENMDKSPVDSSDDNSGRKRNVVEPVPTMLILDAKFSQPSNFLSVCVQRPQLLVALDFLLALIEFFVPTVGNMLTDEEDMNMHIVDAIVPDKPIFQQPSAEFSLSPQRPLIIDDRFDQLVYDGKGGTLYLKDRKGSNLSTCSQEAIIYVGNGKKLRFTNVVIKNGKYLDSCIMLGSNSSYSVSEDDGVFLENEEDPQSGSPRENLNDPPSQSISAGISSEFVIEFQAVGPELTFYNSSKVGGESQMLSNRLLHAQLDAFGRLVLKGDTIKTTAHALGLTMESNGIRILEPFDTSIEYSSAGGKTNIHVSVSDIYMNFSFSILRLFLAVEEDILAFLSTTSKKRTVVCSEFDKVGTIRNPDNDQIYVFWRARPPPGFAVLSDCLMPMDKPPTKGVVAVNTNFARVKKPISFKLVWPPSVSDEVSSSSSSGKDVLREEDCLCSIWFPEAPKGYVALGCVASRGRTQPPPSAVFCIPASLVSPCSLRDCITIDSTKLHPSNSAFWRVDNAFGSFLPADSVDFSLIGKAYELCHLVFGLSDVPPNATGHSEVQTLSSGPGDSAQSESTVAVGSGRRFEAVASFELIWWNRGSSSRKKLSIWRPVVPQGMIYFGDIAVQGYEPPNSCVVLHDTEDNELLKPPLDLKFVSQIKKQRGLDSVSFWLPQAPPGYVSLGCVACRGPQKQTDFSKLRCIRNDMVTGDKFFEQSVWDSSDARLRTEPFSIWLVDNKLATFIVRPGLKKPPRRFAMKLADSNSHGEDNTVVDAEIGTFSAALFDDYGGLMVPLFNIALSGIVFSVRGRTDYLNSTVNFSLVARSYNDKYESWEPLVEPVDGVLRAARRYLYDLNAPGAASQLRFTSTGSLNMNVSVSNANMILQAYASWNNLSNVKEYYQGTEEALSSVPDGKSIIDIHHKKSYYIIPENKLGQDIFIRVSENQGLADIVRMPSGDMKPVKVPVSKNMLDAHFKGKHFGKVRTMVAVFIMDAELLKVEGLTSHQYSVAIRLIPDQSLSSESVLRQESARTRGSLSDYKASSELETVNWSEMFFFKVDSLENYVLELIVTDMGRGHSIGFFSASLSDMARMKQYNPSQLDITNNVDWVDLHEPIEGSTSKFGKSCGRLRFGVLSSPKSDASDTDESVTSSRSGFIQISPHMEGPWTTVRLNYSAPAACWRIGSDVVASEVSVNDGNRYVTIRSLVRISNNTNHLLDIVLVSKNMKPLDDGKSESSEIDKNKVQTEELFETEKLSPSIGWERCSVQPIQHRMDEQGSNQTMADVALPSGWEWIDEWHLDTSSVNMTDGWVYAPDIESLKWPESHHTLKFVNYARQRRWIRNRKQISDDMRQKIYVGQLGPGETMPLPQPGLTQSGQYVLQLRPSNLGIPDEYCWSSVVNKSGEPEASGEMCVSRLTLSEELLCCTQISGSSSNNSHKLWFCVSIQATEIAKDTHSNPIQDWCLVIKAPLTITNYLPFAAEYSVFEMQASGHFVASSRGVFHSGKTVKEAVPLSSKHGVPAKTISLRSSISGRIVQLILDQNYDQERPLLARIIRVYAPYWFSTARCPPLTFRLINMSGKKQKMKIFHSKKINDVVLEEITEEEVYEGHTIASALNFNSLGLSISATESGTDNFGPVKNLSALGDMDGSLDIYAGDDDGNSIRLFISTKPCPYSSVPTKVVSVRPFITFTNRIGEDVFIKLNSADDLKVLHASDSRASFSSSQTDGVDRLQVQLRDTQLSYPVQILKEDTICLVLRGHNGSRKFLRTEIRGYEEGSRFIVVFRLGSTTGPIRIENRTASKEIHIRQSGFGVDNWIHLESFSSTNFSWEDPYGQKLIDVMVDNDDSSLCKIDLEKSGLSSEEERKLGLQVQIVEKGDIKIVRFTYHTIIESSSHGEIRPVGNWGLSPVKKEIQNSTVPLEVIIELGIVGVSIVDHRPRELSYIYLEKVCLSYSTGYDGGTTSRFKLILGSMQLDNQLPLTLMPVLVAPEQSTDMNHPVFKMTVTAQNENTEGVQVYPYVYIRVTDKCLRINIHEPIIWALVDFYSNLQLDRLPQSSNVTQVDPEIRIDLIDVSEVRLKVSLETAPAERPHGVLGVWSPILSAVGNAFKIQVHLRRVMNRDRFMRKSSIVPAITNRIWRDLIHNPLHLIFSVDVLGMTSSTLASLSKGFAELSTDGQFLQLRTKQVWSRRITGVSDGIIQGTEALAQGFAFGVSGVVRKPVESARQNGLLGLAHGLGRAALGFIVQPVSGVLDFFSLTVDGIGASCSRCVEVFQNKGVMQRIRLPRAIHADGVLREYCERKALGQMILHLAEASRHFGCTEIFKEPSKYALSDYYEDHFSVTSQRIVLVTNKRVMLLQSTALDKLDKKPCKILWDVPWEELMALELAKAGSQQPSHVMLHLKNFKRSENFVRFIKCHIEEVQGPEQPQAVRICSVIRKIWKAYQSDMKNLTLKVPSSQRRGRDTRTSNKVIIKSRDFLSPSSSSERKFVKHSINFSRIWSSERETKGRCSLCKKQASEDGGLCSIWRPICPDGYISIGDVAHVGMHPPNVAAVYQKTDGLFAVPVGYDLVWRNCLDDYTTPVSIWHPRAPDGFISPGCVAIDGFEEPATDLVYCVAESLAEETEFEEQKVWSAQDSFPWACHIYQVRSQALHFVALRQSKEDSNWKPMRVVDNPQP
ncbi:hypothetical protein ACFE04_031465 [Oxalis oulophora]